MSSATKAKFYSTQVWLTLKQVVLTKQKKDYKKLSDQSLDSPKLNRKLSMNWEIFFTRKANQWLDQQNVMQARTSWEQSRKYYESAIELDGNIKAEGNLASLNKQIEERINSLVCLINGLIWRDKNGDGIAQKNENRLQGKFFGIKITTVNTTPPMNLFKNKRIRSVCV